jgi:hypothetical protein
MKAKVTSWEVRDHGVPAIWTRREHRDGSITFDGIYEVSMKFDVVGNMGDVKEFLNGVKVGQQIKSMNFGGIETKGQKENKTTARKYVFE